MASSFISAIAIFTGMGFIPSPKCPYALKAEVLEAIEGGPVVIRLQVRNIGHNPPNGILPFVDLASLQVAAPLSACELTTPKSWGPASTPAGLIDGYWDGYADLPKEGWESWLNLHQECEHISS